MNFVSSCSPTKNWRRIFLHTYWQLIFSGREQTCVEKREANVFASLSFPDFLSSSSLQKARLAPQPAAALKQAFTERGAKSKTATHEYQCQEFAHKMQCLQKYSFSPPALQQGNDEINRFRSLTVLHIQNNVRQSSTTRVGERNNCALPTK